MDFFTFLLIMVAIISGTEMVGKIFGGKGAQVLPPPEPREPPPAPDDLATLERRLERMEERLAFLEELKAPPRRTELEPGRDTER